MEPISPKTSRIFIWVITAFSILFVLALVFVNQIDFSSKIKNFEQATDTFFAQTLQSENLPTPLRGIFGKPQDPLTGAGVLMWTNKNREDNGVKDLTINTTLSEMASKKLADLFAKQYFEHESPSGVGPSDLAKQVGYDYIVIGENLALGNFNGDKDLVDAWMASPGHRANILNTRYIEIGIAVGQGVYDGKTTWIAVQEFGLPITACSEPSSTNKTVIDQYKKDIDTLQASLVVQKTAIDNAPIKYGDDYNTKVDEYNASVEKFNAKVLALKAKISAYNKQVAAFNVCAEIATTTTEKL